MRKNLVVNKETRTVMLQVIDTLRASGLSEIETSTLIGILLYIKKKQQVTLADSLKNEQPLFEMLDNDDELYDEAQGIFVRTISKISTQIIKRATMMIYATTFSDEEYLYWFDFCISQLVSKYYGEFFTNSESFSLLAEAFITTKQASIFVPFGGMMELATDLSNYQHIEAKELNKETWLMGMIRLGLADKLRTVDFINEPITTWTQMRYDAILSIPPLSMKIEMSDEHAMRTGQKQESAELVPANRFLDVVKPEGMGVYFMAPSVLWSNAAQRTFRMWAMEHQIIDTVILLPKGMLSYTNIPLVCVILKKQPHLKNAVKFIDASEMYDHVDGINLLAIDKVMEAYHKNEKGISDSISYDTIIENDYSWHLPIYLQHKETEIPDGYSAAYIEDIADCPKYIKGMENDKGKALKVTDLSNDWTKPYISKDSLSAVRDVKGYSKLTQTALVISLTRNLKPSIIEASEESPVWLAKNVLAILPHKEIDIEYLCMALSKANIPSVGTAIPYFSKTSILRYKIIFPSLSVQKTIYKEACQNELVSKAKENGLLDLMEHMKTDYINEVRARKHDMMPHLRQMSSARKNLEYYLTHRDSMSDEEFMDGMKEEVANQKAAIDSLTNILKIFSRESQFGEPEIINIDKFLSENYPDGENYLSEIDRDYQALANYGFEIPEELLSTYNLADRRNCLEYLNDCPDYAEGINIFMAKDDLQRLCDNIFSNAIKHGFTDPKRKDYSIWVKLTVDADKDMFQIDFTNNGTPLPKGLDKLRFGLRGEKAGVHAGTGEGGYIVKSIVNHYGGDYDIFTEKDGEEIWTTIRIYLPIYRNDNEQ